MKAVAVTMGAAALVAPLLAATATQAASPPDTVNVSPSGQGSETSGPTFTTINAALAAVASGGTVTVQPGTYTEDVAVTKAVTIKGVNSVPGKGPTIDATRLAHGINITASNVTITGMNVKNATSEAVLVSHATAVTVKSSNVTGSGTGIGLIGVKNSTIESDNVADNGTGILLQSVTGSTVKSNNVTDNTKDGILLSDETGPTANNQIASNNVTTNAASGIVLSGRNAGAAPRGVPAPGVAGVFSNTLTSNSVTGNGGAGVELTSHLTGGAVYNNTVKSGLIGKNGQAGVAVHSLAAGQDFHGNTLSGLVVLTNNTKGDHSFSVADTKTTAVFVGTVDPLSITFSGNTFQSNQVGIFNVGPVTEPGAASSTFTGISTKVTDAPAGTPSDAPAGTGNSTPDGAGSGTPTAIGTTAPAGPAGNAPNGTAAPADPAGSSTPGAPASESGSPSGGTLAHTGGSSATPVVASLGAGILLVGAAFYFVVGRRRATRR